MNQKYSRMHDTLCPSGRFVSCEVYGFTKAGKPTKREVEMWHSKYSPLFVCDVCGKRGTNLYGVKNAVHRVFAFKDPASYGRGQHRNQPMYEYLCLGCRNTVYAITERWRQLEAMRIEVNRLKRNFYEIAKNNV